MITFKLKSRKSALFSITFFIATITSIIFLFYIRPANLSNDLYQCYYVLVSQLIVYLFIWIILFALKKIDIFEPIVLVTFIHLLLFVVTPIISLYQNDLLWFNKNVWDGCIKGTLLSTLAYIFFIFGYYFGTTKKRKYKQKCIKNWKKIYMISLAIWFFCFACNIIYVLSTGINITYVLTLGNSGSMTIEETSNSMLGFIGMISYGMISSYLYIFYYSKSKLLKSILFYLMFSTYLIRGFRFIIVAIIVAPLFFIYIKENKRPSVVLIIALLLFLSISVGFIGGVRDDMRAGNGIGNSINSIIQVKYITSVIIDNFSIYKTYYGIVQNIPSLMNYTYGKLMFMYTLIMFIPRVIWPSKPNPISQKINEIAVSKYASKAGTAYPYLGEYYHEFGVFGIMFFSYLFGKICNWIKTKMYEINIHSIILYSSICPLLLQIMIRGYTPSNFYLIIFSVLPIIILKNKSIYED